MIDPIDPERPPAMQPEVRAVVEEGLRRGWRVRYLSRNRGASDDVLAYELVRQVAGEAQVVTVAGRDSAAAFHTPERTFIEAPEDAETVTWFTVGPVSSILDEIDRSTPASEPFPRPEETRVPFIPGASWQWVDEREWRRNP